jgi:hypothetical protein
VVLLLGAIGVAGTGVAVWWWFDRPAPAPPVLSVPAVPPPLPETQRPLPVPPPPDPPLPAALPRPPTVPPATPLRTIREILAQEVEAPTLSRLAENPRLFVVDFPSLAAQAAAFDRVAALIGQAHAWRDRVPSEEERAAHLAAGGGPAAGRLGHSYRGSDLARFFALLARQGLPRRPEEARIESWLMEIRRQVPEDEVVLISIPRTGPQLDAALRRTILRQRIARGVHLVDAEFAAHARRIWQQSVPSEARAAIRRFLVAGGYDVAEEDAVIGEAVAHLLFTEDPRLFSPTLLGMTAETVEHMRALLRPAVPEGLRPLMLPDPAAQLPER